jgi:biotin carboxyl carrier protein
MMNYVIIAIIAYLLGSISFGMIVAKLAGGPNLREVGSKNTGATNVLRVMGVKVGLTVFVLDILKEHKEHQEEQKRMAGVLWNEGKFPNLVFTHEDGSHLSQPTIWKAFQKALEDAGLPITDENIFIAASCKEKGILFLKDPAKAPMGCRFAEESKPAAGKGGPVTVTINGKAYGVEIKGDGKAVVNGKPVDFKAEAGIKAAAPAAAAPAGGTEVKAPVPGTVLRVTAQSGQSVSKGDEILVMDVMKMETPVAAPCDGTVTVLVGATDKVATGDVLAVVG